MIFDLKHYRVLVALILALIAGGDHTVQGQHQTPSSTIQNDSATRSIRRYRLPLSHTGLFMRRESTHDQNGTGKFYMGREIAQVMGPGGIPGLRPPRARRPRETI